MIYFSKIVPFVFYPITLILGLMIWSLLSRKKVPLLLAVILFWFCSVPYVSNSFVVYLEKGQIRKSTSEIIPADVVVVLGGMLVRVNSSAGPIYEWADPDRYLAGIEMMKAHKAQYLLFTSSKLPWNTSVQSNGLNLLEGQFYAKFAQENGIAIERIEVSQEVQNTAQEAQVVKAFLQKRSLRSVILVTSNFHMTRAKQIFEQQAIEVQTYPVDSRVNLADITILDFLPDARAFSQTQFAWHEFMGRAFYALQALVTNRSIQQ